MEWRGQGAILESCDSIVRLILRMMLQKGYFSRLVSQSLIGHSILVFFSILLSLWKTLKLDKPSLRRHSRQLERRKFQFLLFKADLLAKSLEKVDLPYIS